MKRKGVSLTELMVSALIITVVMAAAAGFAVNFFDVSYIQSKQIQNTNELRTAFTDIATEISNAAYIYPANVSISLNSTTSINTDSAVAMLFKENDQYGFTAYYLQNNELYQFVQAPSLDWDTNTCPASDMLSFSGNITKVISDIDTNNISLNYILNYNNGITDDILQGKISGVATNNVNALIKGVDWEIAQDNVENQVIKVKEFSKNVPRFIE